MVLAYPIKLTKDGGAFLVTCKDLPEVTTFGNTRDEALEYARGALEEALASRIADKQDIPPVRHGPRPSRGGNLVPVGIHVELTCLLYQTMRDQGVRKSDLARRMGVHAPQIDRLLDVNHKSKLEQYDGALRVLGKRLTCGIVDLEAA